MNRLILGLIVIVLLRCWAVLCYYLWFWRAP